MTYHVTITNERGEHITGTVHSIVIQHAYSDAYVKVLGAEIEAIAFTDGDYDPEAETVTVVYPSEG